MAEQIRIVTPYGPTDALHWFLSDEEQMWQALKELIRVHGHRGTVMEWPSGDGREFWQLELNDDKGNTAVAWVGSHLVFDFERLRSHDQTIFEVLKYDEGEQ